MASSEISERSDEERDVLGSLPLLSRLDDNVAELVREAFVPIRFAFGETIFAEGDEPDGFYVLASGLARVLRTGDDGDEVPLNVLKPGDSFGEGGVAEREPRSATVRASAEVEVYRLDLPVFDALVRLYPEVREAVAIQPRVRRLSDFLRVHSAFSKLPREAIAPMLEGLRPVQLDAGDMAVRQGDPGGSLFIVEEGKLRVYEDADGERRDLRWLRTGDFFGELSLYAGVPRTATVEALTPTRLLELDEATFGSLMDEHPAFRERIEERLRVYEAGAATSVPLDFAELLPADASEAALVEELSEEQVMEHGVDFTDLDAAAAAGLEGFKPPKKFPFVRQIDEMDCGAASVAMICRYYGRDVAVSHIRQAVGTGADGTSLRGIQRGGEYVGLEVKAVKASKERLDELPLPAIVHWDGNHWVVLYEVGPTHIRVSDPGRGRRKHDREKFLEVWSGYAALPAPTPALQKAPLATVSAAWLVAFIKPHRWKLVFAALLALVAAALEMLFPVLTQRIVDDVIPARDYSQLHLLALGMVGVLVLSLGASMFQRRMLSKTAVQIDVSTLDYITGRLFGLPMSYFDTRRTGDIERRLSGVRQIRQIVVQQGIMVLTASTQLLAAVVLMFIFSRLMGACFLLVIPVYLLLMKFSAARMRPTFEGLEEEYGRFASKQIDGIKGIATVKAMGAEHELREMLVNNLRQLGGKMYRSDFTMMAYEGVVQITTFMVVVIFMWIGTMEVLAGNLSLGKLLSFNALILLAIQPLGIMLALWDQMQMSRVLLTRLQDIFDYEPEQKGDPESYRTVPTLEGRVTLRSVGFHYSTAPSAKILDDISIDIAPGTTVAIIGRSGSGKSTLAKCLAGLAEVTDGSIAYDGIDMRELRYRDLRRKIGYVLQEPYLFDDTIAGNIAFGEEYPDVDKVRWAAEVANAQDFIERLPLNYETRIGESGMRLSGGQAQRISIARALYHRPPVLIFDEATSALDTESERAVTQNLDRMLEGRTAFVIAHRLSTIRDADLILVLEQGRLAEYGSHEELMQRNGLYAYLSGQQLP